MESQAQSPMLLDQVRNVMRVRHYSIPTERSYLDWIKRYIKFQWQTTGGRCVTIAGFFPKETSDEIENEFKDLVVWSVI